MKQQMKGRLRILRRQANLTQLQLAEILNIERATYSNYENENRTPPLDVLIRLADFYHLTLDSLVRTDISELAGFSRSDLISPDELSVLTAFRALSPSGRRMVLQFISYTEEVDLFTGRSAPLQPPSSFPDSLSQITS